jgi:glycosyltransferase involved in cell wall biosynthesis
MKFSITIPAYKRTFLKEAIDSCLAQTYQDFELIIVNDASPEDLDSIVNSYSDDRIRYYKNEKNCGAVDVVDNWNKCLEYATGDYIICMGDDDKLLPCCLAEYEQIIKRYPNLYVYHGFTQIIDEDSNVFDIQQQRPEWESGFSLVWHRWNSRKRQFIGDFCYSVSHLRKVGGYFKLPLAWASDDVTAARAAKNVGIANTNVPVFQYRVNQKSISKSACAKYKMEAIRLEREWYMANYMTSDAIENDLDEIYYKLLKRDFKKHWERKYLKYLGQDMAYNGFHVFMWIKQRHFYGYSSLTVLRAFINKKCIQPIRTIITKILIK